MKTASIAVAAFATLLSGAAQAQSSDWDEAADRGHPAIYWDGWGVAHIDAASSVDAAFAQGWAQARGRPDQLIELLVQGRGTAASLWGEDYVQSDTVVWTSGLPDALPHLMAALEPEERERIDAYVAGINAFFAVYPHALSAERGRGLPVTAEDVVAHANRTIYLTFVAGNELRRAQRLQPSPGEDDRGSNGWAIAPSRSQNGNAMLLMNPHLPWDGVFTWFESHTLADGENVYGVALLGQPQATIAFNRHLGWTHTVNTLDNADTYVVDLTPDGGYVFDGEDRDFEVSGHVLEVAQPDGSMKQRQIPILRTVHGPVVARDETHAYALRVAGLNDPAYANTFAQYTQMAEADGREEFEAALSRLQNPMFNTIYADDSGEILYVSGGLHPVRASGDAAYWAGVVDGGTAATLWTDYLPYERLLRVVDPAGGFVQNSNEPGFTATYPIALDPADYPADFVQPDMRARPQHGLQMLLSDQSISFDELIAYAHDTKLTFADNVLDDLIAAARRDGRAEATRAADVLGAWNRRTDADSEGAVLFTLWALSALQSGRFEYERDWTFADPESWSHGIADAAEPAAVDALVRTVQRADAAGVPLTLPWGAVAQVENDEGDALPTDLGLGALGAFRVGNFDFSSSPLAPGFYGGTGWVAAIEFADTPRARALLPYGNFEHRPAAVASQYELYAQGALRDVNFTPEAMRKAAVYGEVLDSE
ncbi:penicillin acylase family protein [Aurantiacibacter spongiae]|uniref:Acylase n=1 Tax=Aurantiacibacter spongiae TaxID=2488860 RepID=A0A3N5CNQ5_9SPHN|nr:penicillin acylase family protein [Aurantiacibacter spongiae]RPF70207.1 acylase [Aurantiacibacter spongiae]